MTFYRFVQWFNPWEWTRQLLKLPPVQEGHQAGLVMIQIDGFSKAQFERALAADEMPFLKHLLTHSKYHLHPLYPGIPSTTPAVQGELFYGVKQIVPGFFFFDKETHTIFRMFEAKSVLEVEKRLDAQGKGLLEGGSSYSNLYSGGSKEAHFCAGCLGWNYIWKDVNPVNFVLLALTHSISFIRMTILTIWETVLAALDFLRGVARHEDVMVEFKFVPLRVLICILLRELITLGAILDVERGLPIVHLNLLGYDEQAHRRGPGSKVAHWALKGIDKSIRRIYSAAINAPHRYYDVWIYSDHGQEETIPYEDFYNQSVSSAVKKLFYDLFSKDMVHAPKAAGYKKVRGHGIQWQRGRYLGRWMEKLMPLNTDDEPMDECLAITAMGPIGAVHVFKQLTPEEKYLFARELVQTAKIPLVLLPEENGEIRAWNERGEFRLPKDAPYIIGEDHPYLEEVTKDLMTLCRHPNAGTYTISGWRLHDKPFSFPFENGAHAGPGKEECNAFALLPADAISPPYKRSYLKIRDLREGALKVLRDQRVSRPSFVHSRRELEKRILALRFMTYNVHSCIGMDGKSSCERIARVIARYQPDIVALQELDMGQKRSGGIDQPHVIAKSLEMLYHFHPAIQVEEQKYGIALLSRFPMEVVRAAKLPGVSGWEPRGALWISLRIGECQLQVVNAHLSLYGPERQLQAKALVGGDWLDHPKCQSPVICCGDYNCLPQAPSWKLLNKKLSDVQLKLAEHRPLATWFGRYPIGRIDHIFVSGDIRVTAVDVPRIPLARMASDHLPLITDLEIPIEAPVQNEYTDSR